MDLEAVEWVLGDPLDIEALAVRKCFGDMEPTWMVKKYRYLDGPVLNIHSHWEHQPQPSSRDLDFYKRCRFATFEDAVEAARREISKRTPQR